MMRRIAQRATFTILAAFILITPLLIEGWVESWQM